MTDQEIVLRAFTELRKIAAEYIIEPDPRDAETTKHQMLLHEASFLTGHGTFLDFSFFSPGR